MSIANDELAARYGRLPTAIISDILRVAGAPHQVLHHTVKPVAPRSTIAGPAFCIKGERILGGVPKRTKVNPRYEMFRRIPRGAVALIESGGYEDCVVFGGNIALAFKMSGCRGIVTDGGVRDWNDIASMEMPVFCRFATPISSGGQWAMTKLETPLVMAGQSSSTVKVVPW